jgi:hypothetical protein
MLMNPPPQSSGYSTAAVNRQAAPGLPVANSGSDPMLQALMGERQLAMTQAPGLNPMQGVQSQGMPGPVLPHMQPPQLHPAAGLKPPGMLNAAPPGVAPRGM